MSDDLRPAFAALDDAEAALERLHKTCCEPGRSPRMAELEATLTRARVAIASRRPVEERVEEAIAILEDAGSQIGSLQVSCCAPNRMPLYASMLEDLMTAQLTVNKAAGRGH